MFINASIILYSKNIAHVENHQIYLWTRREEYLMYLAFLELNKALAQNKMFRKIRTGLGKYIKKVAKKFANEKPADHTSFAEYQRSSEALPLPPAYDGIPTYVESEMKDFDGGVHHIMEYMTKHAKISHDELRRDVNPDIAAKYFKILKHCFKGPIGS